MHTARFMVLACSLLLVARAHAQTGDPTAVPGATPAAGEECFPACRPGFVCHQGGCISACNPPCGEGETCSAEGTCAPQVAPEPVPAPSPAPPPAPPEWPEPDLAEPREPPERFRIWAELVIFAEAERMTQTVSGGLGTTATFTSEQATASIGFMPRAQLEVIDDALRIDIDLPFAAAALSQEATVGGTTASEEGGSGVVLGNPTLGLRGMHVSRGLTLTGGFALALPVAQPPDELIDVVTGASTLDDLANALALPLAGISRGLWNLWWHTYDAFALVLPGDVVYRHEKLEVGGELGLGVLFPVRDREDTEAIVQFASHLAFASRIVTAGAALRGVWLATSDGDAFQSSVEPFVEIHFTHVFFGFGLNLALDAPLGVLHDDEPDAWGFRSYVGGKF